jgi:pyruvate dehydrogenase E2 component (dihydrolipoamide acetyltransferase)
MTATISATMPEQARLIDFRSLGGSGPDALLLHGFGSDRMSWFANQTAIGAVAKVFALDLPGHGASGLDVGEGTVIGLAARVATLLDKHGLSGVHLIGHSLGGAIAVLLAQVRPELVASLVLIAPAGLGCGVDPAFLSAFAALTEPEETQTLLERLVVRPRLINKHLVALVLAQLAKPGARQALKAIAEGILRGDAAIEAAAEAVAARALPRLVIWGEDDSINPLNQSKLAAFGGEREIVPGTAHLPHIEDPRRFNERIAAFLRDRAANGSSAFAG